MPFTDLISRCLLVPAVAKQPSGAQQSRIFAKEKMGGMSQNKHPRGGEKKKKHLESLFPV